MGFVPSCLEFELGGTVLLAVDEATEAGSVGLVSHLHQTLLLKGQSPVQILLERHRITLVVKVHVVCQVLRQRVGLDALSFGWTLSSIVAIEHLIELSLREVSEGATTDLLLGHFAIQVERCHCALAKEDPLIHFSKQMLILEHLVRDHLLVVY